MKICEYVPHGAVPDIRGFAPAIVAQNFAKFLKEDERYIISNLEEYKDVFSKSEYGDVYRIGESALYRRLFRKITRLDPYPLHVRAAKIVNTRPVDIFHAHQLEFDVKDFRKRVDKNTKIAVHAHITKKFDPSLGTADCYLVVSEYLKARLIERGFDERLVHIVRNGVDTDIFKPLDEKQKNGIKLKYGIEKNKKVVVFAGRKQEIKGFEVFLEVAKRLLETRDDIFVIAVGSEPANALKDESYQDRQKTREILKQNCNFLDLHALKQTELAEIFGIADIAMLPSKSEPQGMTMIEAMSCSAIVVSTATGGIKESIDNNQNGFLVDNPEDIEAYYAAVKDALNGNFEHIRANAREKILKTFSWEVVTQSLREVFCKL